MRSLRAGCGSQPAPLTRASPRQCSLPPAPLPPAQSHSTPVGSPQNRQVFSPPHPVIILARCILPCMHARVLHQTAPAPRSMQLLSRVQRPSPHSHPSHTRLFPSVRWPPLHMCLLCMRAALPQLPSEPLRRRIECTPWPPFPPMPSPSQLPGLTRSPASLLPLRVSAAHAHSLRPRDRSHAITLLPKHNLFHPPLPRGLTLTTRVC